MELKEEIHNPWPKRIFFAEKSPVEILLESCSLQTRSSGTQRKVAPRDVSKTERSKAAVGGLIGSGNDTGVFKRLSTFSQNRISVDCLTDLKISPNLNKKFENRKSEMPRGNGFLRNYKRCLVPLTSPVGIHGDDLEIQRSSFMVTRLQSKQKTGLNTSQTKEMEDILCSMSRDMQQALDLVQTKKTTDS